MGQKQEDRNRSFKRGAEATHAKAGRAEQTEALRKADKEATLTAKRVAATAEVGAEGNVAGSQTNATQIPVPTAESVIIERDDEDGEDTIMMKAATMVEEDDRQPQMNGEQFFQGGAARQASSVLHLTTAA